MPEHSKMRRHWSSTACRRESIASSSATTRSAPSRSPSMSASVPARDRVEVSDASRTMSTRTSSTRVTTRGSEWTGTTSEETTLRSWRDLRARAATKPTVSPLFTCRATTPAMARLRRLLTIHAADHRSVHRSRRGHPDATLVRSSLRPRARRVGAADPVDRHRRLRHHAGRGEALVRDAQRRRVHLPARVQPGGDRGLQAESRRRSPSTTRATARAPGAPTS